MTSKQERRLVRTSQPKDYPVREQHKPRRVEHRTSRRADLASAIQEWADDLEGIHSVFED
jgi:hypothetical protein